MFTIFRQKRNFVISRIDHQHKFVLVEDLLSGLKIEVHYGDRELEIAEFTQEYELRFYYLDGSEKSVNLLMQGYWNMISRIKDGFQVSNLGRKKNLVVAEDLIKGFWILSKKAYGASKELFGGQPRIRRKLNPFQLQPERKNP